MRKLTISALLLILITGYSNAQSGWFWQNPLPTGNDYEDVEFYGENTGYAVGWNWTIIKTTNSGLNWSQISFFGARFNGLFMVNEDTGFGIANMGISTYKTTDGGVSWTVIFNKAATLIYFTNINTGYFAGYKTTNSGLNWWKQNIDIYDRAHILDIKFIDDNTGYMIGGTNGTIFRTTDGGGTLIPIGLNNTEEELPNLFNLSQNYPNPFNPTSKIKFDVPKTSFTKIIIYDILGREVATLVNEELKPGTYEAEWNAAGFSSGVYFYKIIAGDYTQTKKMVLMK